jgi:hypothetical protein
VGKSCSRTAFATFHAPIIPCWWSPCKQNLARACSRCGFLISLAFRSLIASYGGMVTRHRLLLLAVPVALVLLGVGAWLLWPHTAITRENAAKIHKGMTITEVEVVLGGPQRNEATGPLQYDDPRLFVGGVLDMDMLQRKLVKQRQPRSFPECLVWISDTAIVNVEFDKNGTGISLPVTCEKAVA